MNGREAELKDLIDLEVQLRRDETVSEHDLKQRDRVIGLELLPQAALLRHDDDRRRYLLLSWLRRLPWEHPTPGESFTASYALASVIAVISGAIFGGVTCRVVLAYDGTTPVNVVKFLGVLIATQLLLLLLLGLNAVLHLFRKRRSQTVETYGALQAFLRGFMRVKSKIATYISVPSGMTAPLRELSYYGKLYTKIEAWLAMGLLQRFGLAFNLAALGMLLYLVASSDLAFSWSTTLRFSPQDFKKVTDLLSLPWSEIAKFAVPSLEMITATQYYRLEGRYFDTPAPARASDPHLLGEWWPFLAACLVLYGLLPRVMMLALTYFKTHAALRSVRLDSLPCRAILARLQQIEGHWEAQQPIDQNHPTSAKAAYPMVQGLSQFPECHIIVWRDVPLSDERITAWIAHHMGAKTCLILRAGGNGGDFTAQKAGASINSYANRQMPIIIIVENWEAPGKAIKRFLKSLRDEVGANTLLLVTLVSLEQEITEPGEESRFRIWQQQIAELADPYTGVLNLGERS